MYLTWRVPTAMACCVIGVFVVPSTWFVWLWALILLALIVLDVLLAPSPSVISCRREPLESIHLGESATSRMEVTNTGTRRFRGAVRDAWLPSAGVGLGRASDTMRMDLRPAASGHLAITLHPTRRGFRRPDQVCVRALGPLGLAGRQRSREVPAVLPVLPAFASRRQLPSRLLQLREIDGRSQVRTFGRGTEFDSLREYVRGDDVRSIDWRATARSREPIVRTWRPERDRRVVIVLDTSRLSAARIGDTTRLDAGMDACLLLAALAGRAGDNVAWFAGDHVVRAGVPHDRTHPGAAVRRIMTAMTSLESHLVEPDWQLLTNHVRATTRPGALVVLVTAFEPASIAESLAPHLPTLSEEHRVVLACVSDPDLASMRAARGQSREVYDAAAAERVRLRAQRLRDAVEATGSTVVERQADALPGALADHYVQLKRDGLL